MPRTIVDPRFGPRLRELLKRRGISYRALAAQTYYSKSYLHDLATSQKLPSVEVARRLDNAIGAGGQLLALVEAADADLCDDEADALELAMRIQASDVSPETLERLETAVDELAMAYAGTPPAVLLARTRRHLRYVSRLMGVHATLAQRRRLLVAGGWLSLLAATCHIDLRQSGSATARLTTATSLAEHAEHPEIAAWCLETRAWDVLTTGDYRRAVDLSRQAQATAPQGSSAQIQATAQEGRAWARMGGQAQTRRVLDRVARLVSALPVPEHPEHHYRYDPAKSDSYTATTLSWSGDPAAEEYARAVIRDLESNGVRPRRVASARLDLALALLASGRHDEAAAEAGAAIASGRVVPSNWWRAAEVTNAVLHAGLPEVAQLREVYEAYRPR